MTDSKREDVQGRIENLLRNNPSKSYSKEEIINLVSSGIASQGKKKKSWVRLRYGVL
jgi:hypothetical protein